jgi:hypothetical protein
VVRGEHALGFFTGTTLKTERKVRYENGWKTENRHPSGRSSTGWSLLRGDSTVVLVEGPFDATRTYQAGYSVVALLGQGSRGAIEALPRLSPDGGISKYVVLLDRGAEGSSRRLCIDLVRNNLVSRDCTHRLAEVGRKDPGECTLKELKWILRKETDG